MRKTEKGEREEGQWGKQRKGGGEGRKRDKKECEEDRKEGGERGGAVG